MDALNEFLATLDMIVKAYYPVIQIVFVGLIFVFGFTSCAAILDFFSIGIYKLQFRLTKKRIMTKKQESAIKAIPLFPKSGNVNTSTIFFILWTAAGVAGAVIAADLLVSPVVFISLAAIGFAGYRGSSNKEYIKRRGNFTEILRLFAGNLETYQSVQQSLIELYNQYKMLDEKMIDEQFVQNLARANELIAQGELIDLVVDRVFGGDKVYQQLSHAVYIATHSGPGTAIEYCKERMEKNAEWRKLMMLINTEVGGVKLTATVLEFLLVGGVFLTLLPSWGADMNSLLHEYFFENAGRKMALDAILIAHTVVQFLFNEYLSSKSNQI